MAEQRRKFATRPRAALVVSTVAVALTVTLMPPDARFDEACLEPVSHYSGSGSATAVTATAAGAAAPRGELGFSPGFSMMNAPLDDLRRDLDAMRALGVTRLRIDLSWATLQPAPDRFDWSSADRVLSEARGRDIEILAVIGYEPDWARRVDPDGVPLPVDPDGFATFVGALTERYAAAVSAWEIWNEPNTSRFWSTGPDPVAYAAVVEAVVPGIRAADPSAPIVIGALAPADDTVDDLSPATFVNGIYDNVDVDLFDAISIHPYSYPAQATGRQRWNTFYRMNQVHQIMTHRGDVDTLIWLTEYGAPTGTSSAAVTEQQQADMLATGIQEARRRCYTGPLYLYSLRDAGVDPTDPEDNFGVLREDHTPKASYFVLAQAASPQQG